MLKENQISEFCSRYKAKDPENAITLEALATAIKEKADEYGIPLSVGNEQVKVGGMFSSQAENCKIFWHPEHPADFFRFVLRTGRQGIFTTISFDNYGQSKMFNKIDRKAESAKTGLSSAIVASIGNNKRQRAAQEEQDFYDTISEIYEEICGQLVSITAVITSTKSADRTRRKEKNHGYIRLHGKKREGKWRR